MKADIVTKENLQMENVTKSNIEEDYQREN